MDYFSVIEGKITSSTWNSAHAFKMKSVKYDFIVDYFKVTDCNLDWAEYECQRRQQLQNTLLNTAYKQA